MKIAAFSDCHWLYEDIKKFPKADLCIFAGDWCGNGYYMQETLNFLEWFSKLPYKYKVAIPGNHDRFCELAEKTCKDLFQQASANLLIDEEINIEGLRIYGSPWSPLFMNWAYMLSEEQLKLKFNNIPNNLDILITHTPPKGICDNNLGSQALLDEILIKKPKVSIFGHIHNSFGAFKNNYTKFYNVSICNDEYKIINSITVIKEKFKNEKKI